MVQSSAEAVKSWRRRFRNRILLIMGAKCACCGYDRYHGNLELHHLDPEAKEFTMGDVRASPKALAKLGDEMKKCALVCNRCHGEIHAGVRIGPLESTFDQGLFGAFVAEPKFTVNQHGRFERKPEKVIAPFV